jgi:hypothetical protein
MMILQHLRLGNMGVAQPRPLTIWQFLAVPAVRAARPIEDSITGIRWI